jgi:protein-S-isoprenylcysteine O-methyltransferase Ste14
MIRRDAPSADLIVQGNPQTYLVASWIVFAVVWFVAAFSTKRTTQRQSWASRWLDVAEGWLAWLFLFARRVQFAPLAWRFVPRADPIAWAGVALTVVGIGLAIVARFFLGSNWSAIVTIKQGHTLVRRGPYALVRHPIYSGLLVAILGTAVAIGEIRALIAASLIFALVVHKIILEEKFMTRQFGADYLEYRRKVKALIPFVW